MLRKIVLPIAVFIVILIALTFGENALERVFEWLSFLSGMVIANFGDLYFAARDYVLAHTNKVIVALVLTVPISLWLLRDQGESRHRRVSRRKVAIILALFLGWLGGHRFYLGQVGWGFVYLIIFAVFAPLVVGLSIIDAVRYLFMSDEEFEPGGPALPAP